MTPLARKIVNELTLPIKQRSFRDASGLLKKMSDVHCFDCTEAYDLIESLTVDILRRPTAIGPLAFLPADRTWIEFSWGQARTGFLLCQSGNHDATIDLAHWQGPTFGSYDFGGMQLVGSIDGAIGPRLLVNDNYEDLYIGFNLYAALALINTPRIIGRKQHMPHRGLERRLVAKRGLIGKFPLHAWTEIKLEVCAPKDASGDGSLEAHYTGERALHFCRAHLRVRLGKVEIVKGHWRGDASLGIKQSRYKLIGERVRPAPAAQPEETSCL